MATLLEKAEDDLLAFYSFPADHGAWFRPTNRWSGVTREIGLPSKGEPLLVDGREQFPQRAGGRENVFAPRRYERRVP